MKKQIRFALLFAMTIVLLLSALTAISLSASAADKLRLTIYTYAIDGDEQKLVSNFGTVQVENQVQINLNGEITYDGNEGFLLLKALPYDDYRFVGWKDDLSSDDMPNSPELSWYLTEGNTTVYAIFAPRTYDVKYVGAKNSGSFSSYFRDVYDTSDLQYHPEYSNPSTVVSHTFGQSTQLPSIRTNIGAIQSHTFVQWQAYRLLDDGAIENVSLSALVKNEENKFSIQPDVNYDIYLVPEWEPNQFKVERIDIVGTLNDKGEPEIELELDRYFEMVNFGATVNGKDFGGETAYTGYKFDGDDASLYTQDSVVGIAGLTIYRCYTPCEYTVKFDINAPVSNEDAITRPVNEDITVTYSRLIPRNVTTPKCTGYVFLGYYYYPEEGEKVQYYDDRGWRVVELWEIPDNATLVAEWEIQKHNIIVRVVDENGDLCNEAVQILINGSVAPGALDYGTRGTVQITVLSGQDKKLTKWNGVSIPHTKSITREFEIREVDIEITVQLLSVEPTPVLTVNYVDEILEGFTPGVYRITSKEEESALEYTWEFRVEEDGSYTVLKGGEEPVDVSDLFGKTLVVLRPGIPDQSADGELQELTLKERPVATPKEEITFDVYETKQERELTFNVPNDGKIYEIAYTTSSQEVPDNWTTDLRLKDLEAGVTYTIYLRVRANEDNPHGETVRILKNFEFEHLVDLTPLLVLLICLFALQLLALALLLISRYRSRTSAFSAPLFALLAIKLIPAGVFPWVIGLTIAIVLLQVILVLFAVRTGVIRKVPEKKPKTSEEKQDRLSDSTELKIFDSAPVSEPLPAEIEQPVEEVKPTEEEN